MAPAWAFLPSPDATPSAGIRRTACDVLGQLRRPLVLILSTPCQAPNGSRDPLAVKAAKARHLTSFRARCQAWQRTSPRGPLLSRGGIQEKPRARSSAAAATSPGIMALCSDCIFSAMLGKMSF